VGVFPLAFEATGLFFFLSSFLPVRSTTVFIVPDLGFLAVLTSLTSSSRSSSSASPILEFESESSTVYLTCFEELRLDEFTLAGGASLMLLLVDAASDPGSCSELLSATAAFLFLALFFVSLVGVFPLAFEATGLFFFLSSFLPVRSTTVFIVPDLGFLAVLTSLTSSSRSSSSASPILEFESESSTVYLTCFEELRLDEFTLAGGASLMLLLVDAASDPGSCSESELLSAKVY